MCCASRNRLLEQEFNSLFLYDLCQTVYLSPQICIPAGDVDACLSMECCVSVFFRLLSKTHFSMVLFSHFGAGGERHGFIRRVLFEPLRVMHDGLSIFRALIRQIDEICYRSAANGSFSTCISNLFLYSHWPNFQLLYSPLAKKVSNVLCGLMIVFSVDV